MPLISSLNSTLCHVSILTYTMAREKYLTEVYLTEIAFVFGAGFELVTARSEDVVEIHSVGVLEQNYEDGPR